MTVFRCRSSSVRRPPLVQSSCSLSGKPAFEPRSDTRAGVLSHSVPPPHLPVCVRVSQCSVLTRCFEAPESRVRAGGQAIAGGQLSAPQPRGSQVRKDSILRGVRHRVGGVHWPGAGVRKCIPATQASVSPSQNIDVNRSLRCFPVPHSWPPLKEFWVDIWWPGGRGWGGKGGASWPLPLPQGVSHSGNKERGAGCHGNPVLRNDVIGVPNV